MQHSSSIFNFKKFIVNFFFPFILVSTVIGYTFQTLIEKYTMINFHQTGEYKVNRIITFNDKDEIPVFGSSRTEFSVIPKILGSRYFNYGITNTGDDVNLFFLKQELQKNKSGPILVNFDLEGLRYNSGEIHNYLYSIDNASVRELVGKQDKYYYHVLLLKYYGLYLEYLSSYFSLATVKYKKPLLDKGAMLFYDVGPNSLLDAIEKAKLYKPHFENNNIILNELAHLILSHPRRTFIYIIPPYHSSYFKNFVNEQAALVFLRSLSHYKNVKVLNFSRLDFPDEYFIDVKHLRYDGAVKFSNILLDTLRKI